MDFPSHGFQTAGQAQLHDDLYGTEYATGPRLIFKGECEVSWETRQKTLAWLAKKEAEYRQEWARYTPWTEGRCLDRECRGRADWPGHLVIDGGPCPRCHLSLTVQHVYHHLEWVR